MGRSAAARQRSISSKTRANWQRADKAAALAQLGRPQRPKTEAETELSRVKRARAALRMARDRLRNCAAPFARQSRFNKGEPVFEGRFTRERWREFLARAAPGQAA